MRALEARGCLLDIDVGEDVGGLVRRAGRGLVLVDVEMDGGGADGGAKEPRDTLDDENGVDARGDGLVLELKCQLRREGGLGGGSKEAVQGTTGR